MSHAFTPVAGLALTLALAVPAAAQVKTITGEQRTTTATIDAIEQSTREVTFKKPDGTHTTVRVPPDVTRFSSLKVGDTITARYYENLVVRLKLPGEAAVNTSADAITPAAGAKPGGTAAAQRTITATITAIDQNVPSITFAGPNGWSYSSKVQDKNALAKVKVGDKVDITWTDALLISFDDAAAKE